MCGRRPIARPGKIAYGVGGGPRFGERKKTPHVVSAGGEEEKHCGVNAVGERRRRSDKGEGEWLTYDHKEGHPGVSPMPENDVTPTHQPSLEHQPEEKNKTEERTLNII